MGTVLSKQNRLYWLGRYNERVYTSLQHAMGLYDLAIDQPAADYRDLCERLEISGDYPDISSFLRSWLFDADNPDSIAASAASMIGNGMVLRETISSTTLSYLQMAVNALTMAAESLSPLVELQWVLDDIMAFRGSYEDFMDDETLCQIIKCGILIERLSMFLRLEIRTEDLRPEMKKLLNSLLRSRLPVSQGAQEVLVDWLVNGAQISREQLIESVESLATL